MSDKMVIREIEQAENQMKADVMMTDIKKKSFINEIKSGLGNEIKSNPNGVRVIKKSFKSKIITFFKNIFKTI